MRAKNTPKNKRAAEAALLSSSWSCLPEAVDHPDAHYIDIGVAADGVAADLLVLLPLCPNTEVLVEVVLPTDRVADIVVGIRKSKKSFPPADYSLTTARGRALRTWRDS
jgi:hypothetical protein